MRKFVILYTCIFTVVLAQAQLTIYAGFNLQGNQAVCAPRIIYKDSTIPNALNNKIRSIALDSGFMATLAENADGTGERFSYIASKSKISVNLSLPMQDKISFIRVLKLPPVKVKKKGVCSTNNREIDSIGNTTWFYDWNDRDFSLPSREYAPMAFMWYNTRDSSINRLIGKDTITHYIAFNEPDVNGPSRQFVATAIPAYKNMLKVGLRMGSPSASYIHWQDTFAREAKAQKLAIDYVCVHWYDWGAYMTTHPDSIVSAAGILNRFKAFLNAVYDYYRKPIWITEFNANINRTDSVHHEFMKIALPWLDSCRFVERYAYFFGKDIASIDSSGSLTTAGRIYANHNSVDAYPENIIDPRPAFPVSLAAWQSSAITQGGLNVPTFAPTKLNTNITAPLPLTRGTGLVLPPTSSSNGYWGAAGFSTTTAQDGITDRKFLSFSLKSKNGKTVNYHSISKINIRIGATGPIKYLLNYTVDDGRTFTIDSIEGPSRATGNYILDSIDLSGISNLQNIAPTSTVVFRIIPYDATGTGVFLIGSGINDTLPDLEINGGYSDDNLITAAPLSTKLSSFKLQHNNSNNTVLVWTTSIERNFNRFELERSYDGLSFSTIAHIKGTNFFNGSVYNYTDIALPRLNKYYRLKMVDEDNSISYSHILFDPFSSTSAPLKIYPTIVTTGFVNAVFTEVEKATELHIISEDGRLVKTYRIANGAISQVIETTSLSKGVYRVVLINKNNQENAIFIKQ